MSVDCYVVRGFGGEIVEWISTSWYCFSEIFDPAEVYPVSFALELLDKCETADDEARKVIEKVMAEDNPPDVIGIWPQYNCE